MKKGVLLARVSTPRQEKEGLSLEEIQLPEMQKYAKENGIEVIREFTFSESADEKMRKKFQEMITFVKKHPEVKAIIAYKVDRITRNYRDQVVCDEMRKDYDKELHFVYNRLMIHKHSSGRDIADWDTQVYLAKQQINRLRDDALDSARTQLRMGRKPGQAPIGYQNITLADNRKDIVPDRLRSDHIKEIFDLYATGTHSDRTIADIMRSKGLRTVKGKVLYKTAIETILKNPFYAGSMRHNGELYPHNYQTLISRQLFNKCCEIRKQRAEKGNYKPQYKDFAFRGIVGCWYCKTAVGLDTKKEGRLRYVQCNKTKDRNCPQPRLHEAILLQQVKEDLIIKMRVPDDAVDEVQNEVVRSFDTGVGNDKERMRLLAKQIEESKSFVREAYKDSKRGRITDDDYDQIVKEEHERQEALEGELANFDEPDQSFVISSEYLLSLLNRLPELYEGSRDSEKLEWHRMLFSNASLKQEKLLWELNKPFDAVLACSDSGIWLPRLGSLSPSCPRWKACKERRPAPGSPASLLRTHFPQKQKKTPFGEERCFLMAPVNGYVPQPGARYPFFTK